MKFLLVAVNAKYIHSNLGIYSLKAYADQWLESKRGGRRDGFEIEIGEYTVNHQVDMILNDIYRRQPQAVGFSCYIWNMEYVMELVRDVRKVMPETDIWLGGPEVSFRTKQFMEAEPDVTGIIRGEGEETFARLVEAYSQVRPKSEIHHSAVNTPMPKRPSAHPIEQKQSRINVLDDGSMWIIDGLTFRDNNGKIKENPSRPVMDLSRIPFPYKDLKEFENRIIYYESSRGCPFSCSYCLSSIDKSVRFRDLELVKEELDFFLEHQVPQVKFIDRTFNCNKPHAMAIWQHLLEQDNGVTNFHFEIAAELLDEEELELLKQMRPGLIQLEIGVQTTNQDTLREIHRSTDLEKLEYVVDKINGFGNIHQHLDLIAGLPLEGYNSFIKSFNEVYDMHPSQLQLGFLKVLKGSPMEERAVPYGLVYKNHPPYEVLSTKWLNYANLVRLKAVEEMVEIYYNSRQFVMTLAMLEQEFSSPFVMFEALALEYAKRGLAGASHNRLYRYELLYEFIAERYEDSVEEYVDVLTYDLYLRENVKRRPSFARDQSPYKEQIRDFFIAEAEKPRNLIGYEAYDSKQMSKMAHVEAMGDGSFILFDYLNRDSFSYNAKTTMIDVKSASRRARAAEQKMSAQMETQVIPQTEAEAQAMPQMEAQAAEAAMPQIEAEIQAMPQTAVEAIVQSVPPMPVEMTEQAAPQEPVQKTSKEIERVKSLLEAFNREHGTRYRGNADNEALGQLPTQNTSSEPGGEEIAQILLEPQEAERVQDVLDALDREYGTEYRCYLNYETPWQLLIAVIMSAQCTDARVNIVTAELFKKYDTLEKFAEASLEELEEDIRSTGFYHTKAKNIIACCRMLLEQYHGEVPAEMEELLTLPGVGRKTANVIRGNIYHEPSIVVDTHVKRISKKLGFAKSEDPEKIEYELMGILPKEHWILWNIQVITLGRSICVAKTPKCRECFLREYCPSADKTS